MHENLNLVKTITGEGEQHVEKKDLISEIQTWINEESKKDQKIKIWFEFEFEKKFPEFVEWKKRKEETQSNGNNTPASKIA